MPENAAEVVVGGLVLAAAVGFTLFAAQATGLAKSGTASYPLVASFRSVAGISVGTDVKLAGIKVGTITNLVLNPQTYFADATIAVNKGGTGATTLTGLVKGNGTSAFTAAVAGTDYLDPSSVIDGGTF